MKVSVIIPCHNAGDYLAQTLGSVLAQHEPPAEIILVDDASSDASVAVAARFGAAVRIVRVGFGNAPAARNHGASLASGEALMFLDADDVLGPTALRELTTSLCRYPGTIALCPWYRLEREGEDWVRRPPSCEPRRRGQDPLAAWLGGWYHPPCAVLWSREAYGRVGGWDPAIQVNNDGHIMMRAMARGIPVVVGDVGESFYRRLPTGAVSLSATRFSGPGLRARLRVLAEIGQLLARHDRLDAYRPALAGAYDLLAADCGDDRECQAECRRAARALGGPGWWRVLRRTPRRLPRQARRLVRQLLPRPPGGGESIRHGFAPPVIPADRPAPPPPIAEPVVSVVIPAYNRAHVLPRALASVLPQQGVLEVLVVDDGSSDDTGAVVRHHADPRIRYLRQPRNMGAAAARNRGLQEARGEFIALLDSDDEWLPGKLARQLALFRRLPATVGMVYTGSETVDSHGLRQEVVLPTVRGDIHHRLLERNLLHGVPSNALLRREAVARIGGFDEAMPAIEDYDYWLRLSRHYQVDFVAAVLSRYHDPASNAAGADPARLSRNLAANLAARHYLHRRHGEAMRRAGVEHRFLLETARRHLKGNVDPATARWLVLRAIARQPLDPAGYPWLLLMLLPWRTREVLRRGRQRLLAALTRRQRLAGGAG